MHKFTHIGGLLHVARYIKAMDSNPDCPPSRRITTPVEYKGTVKLHGSNCGVEICRSIIAVQSRSRVITPEDDNYGFAAFVNGEEQHSAIRVMDKRIRQAYGLRSSEDVVLYGEWIGPGIQRGMAISELPDKQWVLFAIKVVDGDESRYLPALSAALPTAGEFGPQRIYSIEDVEGIAICVDFSDQESKEVALDISDRAAEIVESMCPWASKFGVSGLGEGVVWTPIGEHWGNTNLYFKSKGTKHKEVKSTRESASLDPELIKSIDSFLDFAVTPQRLEQGIEAILEQGHAVDVKSMGHYLKWLGQNVKRESAPELESNELEWSQVGKAVTAKAREFFLDYLKSQI